jgi:hypothetical protein
LDGDNGGVLALNREHQELKAALQEDVRIIQ